MSGYSASAPSELYEDGGFDLHVTSPSDVTTLVTRLADPLTGTAHIEFEQGEGVVQAHVEGAYGYLFHVDERGAAYSLGDPDSPAVDTDEQSFPAGGGITINALSGVLTDLLTSSSRPTTIEWHPLDAPSQALTPARP
ncbi:Imm1 family immunity protein [Kutzneria sp. CA-103260]|uniref:Imm1 family immunity protein n=1 Tax=Kutzneria sp. CA-103260 TaxID=2802641 RepID=UPI001BA479D5|nr:Imm1 family immunity protein [Kutzneria sp. CA-103260]QUQ67093.1 Immunity protein Imm1 [Kutzneria sp. CA-103260]